MAARCPTASRYSRQPRRVRLRSFSWPAARPWRSSPLATQDKSVEGFGESRRGDVPEGTAEMMTPETDKAIKNGLAWLGRSQNADGSFGGGTYRGNIAVTSLAGPGVHGIRLEPRSRARTGRRSTRPWST